MHYLLILSAAEVRQALPMADCIAGMKQAYLQLSSGRAEMPLRARVGVPAQDGLALFMPAFVAGDDAQGGDLAVKVVSVFPRNAARGLPMVHAAVLVLDAQSGRPLALLEGGSLTAIRTGAGGGASVDVLARPEARVLALLGSGVQARSGLEAVCTVRPIDAVRVYSLTPAHAERLAADLAGVGPIPANIQVMRSAGEAVRGADLVYAATTAATPVFDGRDLAAGAHVIGVGSYTPQMQEVDATTVQRAAVFVDARAAALTEAGDLIVPLERGLLRAADVVELGAVLAGQATGRRSADQITFFKSVGVAAQDAVAARIALRNALAAGLGQRVPFG